LSELCGNLFFFSFFV